MCPKLRTGTQCFFIYINVCACVASICLAGRPDSAQAAIFEQLSDGDLVHMDGRGSAETPASNSVKEEVSKTISAGAGMALPALATGYPPISAEPARPLSAVVFDMPASPTMPILRSISKPMILPKPRRLSASFSAQQRQMRSLTAEVGLRYSRTPGVIRARLNQKSFVKLFTMMIHRESNFNPRAISRAGAKGLGQLMPATAIELGVCDPFSPRENLQGAARYLTSMLYQFGSPGLALAAYNAGPGAVTKHRGIPPYRETKQYVSDILNAIDRSPIDSDQFAASLSDNWSSSGSLFEIKTFAPKATSQFGCAIAGTFKQQSQSVYE